MNDFIVKISKKGQQNYGLKIVLYLFVLYFPLRNFIEEYYVFGNPEFSFNFFLCFIVLVWFCHDIMLYVYTLFRKVRLTISGDKIIINHYFFCKYVIALDEFDTVEGLSYKGKHYIIFHLANFRTKNGSRLFLLNRVLFRKKDKLFFLIKDLDISMNELVDQILMSKEQTSL